MKGVRLRVNEIFLSLQGESDTQGLPTVFVRLTGCPLRCSYCDTAHAFVEGEWRDLSAILEQVSAYAVPRITVTGGEPLAQPGCLPLLSALCDMGLEVSLETSGALDVAAVDSRVRRVMDLKTPGSGEESRNYLANLEQLRQGDQVKFVLRDEQDYRWAKSAIERWRLAECCHLLMLPVYGELSARCLAEWVLRDRLPVRVQLQLHKQLWGSMPGR